MTEEQYFSLSEKYLKGNCTPEEELQLKSCQQEQGLTNTEWDQDVLGEKDRLRMLVYNRLQDSLHQSKFKIISSLKWQFAAAAVLLVFMATGLYIYRQNTQTQLKVLVNKQQTNKYNIQTGTTQAILIVNSGKQILLDHAVNGVLDRQGNSVISKSGHGLTISNQSHNSAESNATTLNTIRIPRGSNYDITLSDGTKVWLNSCSALTFPTNFNGTERKVTLIGEGYFEVAKNKKMPFKINVANKQKIEVLGTHFNVEAYADENVINTTLLEGSVKILSAKKEVILKPGQMATNQNTQLLNIKQANLEEVMAWKNGLFIFNNESITSIMKKISRWYNVDVAYEGNLNNINFVGSYARSKSLMKLLQGIAMMDKVHFKIEGRRIIVIANKYYKK